MHAAKGCYSTKSAETFLTVFSRKFIPSKHNTRCSFFFDYTVWYNYTYKNIESTTVRVENFEVFLILRFSWVAAEH